MRTFGNIGTYVSVGSFYTYPYVSYGYGSCDNVYPEYARDSFVKSTIKNVSKLAALPKNYFKKNMVVFHKKFGRGIIKSITEIRISVMFDDCRLKVLDKQTVLQGRLLLSEKDNNATLKTKLKKTSAFK